MRWEIKSDCQHQEFYRKVLDELESRWQQCRWEYLDTSGDDPSTLMRLRKYNRSTTNYMLVKDRYDRERFNRGWKH